MISKTLNLRSLAIFPSLPPCQSKPLRKLPKTRSSTNSTINLANITATKLLEGQPRVLLEASSYGVPSIYPNFGGMNEFFPSDYKLSFNQFNYDDLEKKILMLHNTKLLSDESKEITKHLTSNYTEEILYRKFENILKNKENE